MKKNILLMLIIVLSLSMLFSCGSTNVPSVPSAPPDSGKPSDPTTPPPSYGVVDDEEAHYLIFKVEDIEIEKMLVVSTDTYENLEAYFPTIPVKEGFNAYWEEVAVYSDTQNTIYINAYYVRKQ